MKSRRLLAPERSIHQSGKVRIAAGLALVALVAFGQSEMKGGTCVVDPVVMNNADSGAGSLRQAILDACDGSTVSFASTVVSPITLASALAIDKNLTIQGPGAKALTISGNNAVRVFNIGTVNPAINVTLSGLTVADGNPGYNFGGGILNTSKGTVTVASSAVTGNSAVLGGAICNQGTGTMNVTNCVVSGNSGVYFGGGGIFNDGGGGTINVTSS